MYRIDTGQARTDIYDGKPLDLSLAANLMMQTRKEKAAQEAAKQEEQDKRVSDIVALAGKMKTGGVLDREKPMFAQMQSEFYDNFKKNMISKIKAGDNNALIDAQQQLSDINNKAEQSTAMKSMIDKNANEMLAHPNGGFDAYRKQSVDYLHDQLTNPENNGKYDYDPTQIQQRFDLSRFVTDKLVGEAHEQAPNQGGYKSNTQAQRKQQILDAIKSDPLKMQAANDEYEEAQDKLGAKDPLEYVANKYENKLLVDDKPQAQEWQVSNAAHKNDIDVTHTVTDAGGQIHVMNPKTNEQITVDYNDKGEVTGGTEGTRLSPAEKTENDAVFKSNIAKDKLAAQKKSAAELYRSSLKLGDMSDADQKAAIAQYNAMLQESVKAANSKQPLPHKEKGIELDAKQAQEVAHDKFSVKPHEIIAGKTPANVNIQKIENKTAAAKKDWSKYKRQ